MMYESPEIQLQRKKEVTSDEWWWVGLILLFVIWAYSQYQLQRAIDSCRSSGGLSRVDSYVFGTVWKVECYQP